MAGTISTLKSSLQELFALAEMFPAIGSMTVDELRAQVDGRPAARRTNGAAKAVAAPKAKAPAKKRSGRLARRSEADLHKALDQILSVVVNRKDGMRAEEIQAALGFDKRELPAPIALGIKKGALKKTGQRRATRYFLGTRNVSTSKKAPKKNAKK